MRPSIARRAISARIRDRTASFEEDRTSSTVTALSLHTRSINSVSVSKLFGLHSTVANLATNSPESRRLNGEQWKRRATNSFTLAFHVAREIVQDGLPTVALLFDRVSGFAIERNAHENTFRRVFEFHLRRAIAK
jgi:hypothetical protein